MGSWQENIDNKDGLRSSEDLAEILPALVACRKAISLVQKGGKNQNQGYTYARFEDYIAATEDAIADHNLFIVATMRRCTLRAEEHQGRTRTRCVAELAVRAIHAPSKQWIEVTALGEGDDPLDKASYKAVTGARKYGLQMLLNLASSDDPEKDNPSERADNHQASKAPSANQTRATQAAGPPARQSAPQQQAAPPAPRNEPQDDAAGQEGEEVWVAAITEWEDAQTKNNKNYAKITLDNGQRINVFRAVEKAKQHYANGEVVRWVVKQEGEYFNIVSFGPASQQDIESAATKPGGEPEQESAAGDQQPVPERCTGLKVRSWQQKDHQNKQTGARMVYWSLTVEDCNGQTFEMHCRDATVAKTLTQAGHDAQFTVEYVQNAKGSMVIQSAALEATASERDMLQAAAEEVF